jgi:hypothetical protein
MIKNIFQNLRKLTCFTYFHIISKNVKSQINSKIISIKEHPFTNNMKIRFVVVVFTFF